MSRLSNTTLLTRALASADFSVGTRRFLQLLGLSLLSCRLYCPAGVMHIFNQSAMHHAAFAPTQGSRPPDLKF